MNRAGWYIGLAGFGEELLDHSLGSHIVPFPETMVAYSSLRVDEIMRRPILVMERASSSRAMKAA
jgi:hypothetical protein